MCKPEDEAGGLSPLLLLDLTRQVFLLKPELTNLAVIASQLFLEIAYLYLLLCEIMARPSRLPGFYAGPNLQTVCLSAKSFSH